MKVKSKVEVAQLCLTLSDLMDCSLPGSSVHGIFQTRVLEWGAIAFSARVQLPVFKFQPLLAGWPQTSGPINLCLSVFIHKMGLSASVCHKLLYINKQSSVHG